LKRIVLANLASPGNPGDYAILMGSLKLLREYYRNPSVTLVTRHFSEAQAYNQFDCNVVPSYPNVEHIATDSRLKKIFLLPRTFLERNEMAEAIRHSDIVFLIGGGYFYSYRRFGAGANFLSYCLPVYFAKRFKKPVVLLPQSYGPLESGTAQWLLGRTLSGSDIVFSRELISLDWLKLRYPSFERKYRFMPDLGFLLEPSDLGIEGGAEPRRKTIGVTVRPWHVGGADKNKYIQSMVNALAFIQRQFDAKILIITQVVRPTRGESDKEVSEALARNLTQEIGADNVGLEIREPYFPLSDLCRIYRDCDFLVAMRLHSAILSFVMGCPALVIGYQHKAEGILASTKLQSLYVNSVEKMTSEELRNACSQMEQNLENSRRIIQQTVHRVRNQIRQTFTDTMRNLRL